MPGASERGKAGWLAKLKHTDAAQRDEAADERQQQLLLLFEKRNQLKREFGKALDELETLRNEHASLAERHARCAERLDGLEAMLADPQRGQNAIIYYRLSALWRLCETLLRQRREELIEKFEQLERQKLLDSFKASAVEQQRLLERKFAEYDSMYQEMAGNLKALQDRLRGSDKPWHYFRRKKLAAEAATAETQAAPVVAQRDECLAELERVRDREPPPFTGLSVAAKREVNLQLLALAQQLYVHFRENDLAMLARATRDKHPGDTRYGTPQECFALERPIAEAVAGLKAGASTDRVRRRADYLRQQVQFTGNADTVPQPHALNRIALSPGATSQSIDAVRGDLLTNVLEQDYWNVDALLLREDPEKA